MTATAYNFGLLTIWGERVGAKTLSRPTGSDSSGLAYDANKTTVTGSQFNNKLSDQGVDQVQLRGTYRLTADDKLLAGLGFSKLKNRSAQVNNFHGDWSGVGPQGLDHRSFYALGAARQRGKGGAVGLRKLCGVCIGVNAKACGSVVHTLAKR